MKKIMLRAILPAIVALAVLGNSAQAQTKIATVDVSKLFKNYWKTKQAQASLDDRKAQIDKDEASMIDDLKKGNADYEQLLDRSNDQALSADERAQKKQAATDKLKALQDSKAALDQYDRSAKANLQQEIQRMHDKIVAEIQTHVASAAKDGGYTLILDSSAQSAMATPTVVYSSSDADLTDKVLKQLNAGAPIDTAPASPAMSSPPALGGK